MARRSDPAPRSAGRAASQQARPLQRPDRALAHNRQHSHRYSAQQILPRLRELGLDGGRSIVKDDVARIRPRPQPAFLNLDFAPGECAQVDWSEWGTIAVGNTRRRLSLFVMVLCYSRRMYWEFTVSQTMEFFLACHPCTFSTPSPHLAVCPSA